MLKEEEYNKIIEFQRLNAETIFDGDNNSIYGKKLLRLLDRVLGYSYSFHGYLANLDNKEISPNGSMHGITPSFFQTFLSWIWKTDLDFAEDKIFIFSETPNYKKSSIYRNALKPAEFKDFLFFYLRRSNGRFLSYLFLFSKNNEFSDFDRELFTIIKKDITVNYENYMKIWNLKNDLKMLRNTTNYFPIGVMTVENTNMVTYTNPLAREYLKELGYEDPRFYSTFYINELYPSMQYDMETFGESKSIRIKNFMFSLSPTGNPGKNLDQSDRPLFDPVMQVAVSNDIHYTDTSVCIYIVKDDNYSAKVSRKTLKSQGLTNRECQVAEYIINGASNSEIADALMLSTNTVKIHVSNIYNKTNVRSRTELINFFYSLERDSD